MILGEVRSQAVTGDHKDAISGFLLSPLKSNNEKRYLITVVSVLKEVSSKVLISQPSAWHGC